jgi:hypothetical protein
MQEGPLDRIARHLTDANTGTPPGRLVFTGTFTQR